MREHILVSFLFYFFGVVTLAAAIAVVAQKQVFHAALSLIVCLGSLAAIYLLMEAPFIAAIQAIVYAGAIMVLFLFVIMLLDPQAAARERDRRKLLGCAAATLALLALGMIAPLLHAADLPESALAEDAGSVHRLGRMLFTEYAAPFEVTSVLILTAIIGIVALAGRRS